MIRKKSSVPTMKDVAAEAGVAVGTVSRVINGKPVAEEYRRKVYAAIEKLDYHVNSYAQGLKASRTFTAALLIPNIVDPYFSLLAQQISRALANRSYKMLLCCTDFNARQEQEYIDMIRMNKVDGVIGLTYNPELIVDQNLPFVSIDRVLSPSFPCVTCDNYYGGRLAAQKLAELGCLRVIFLRVGSDLNAEPDKRKLGFENGCREFGLELESVILGDGHDLNVAFLDYLKTRMPDGVPDYDGIFCVTDQLAYFVQGNLRELGLVPGKDIQLIGFDGIRYLGMGDPVCSSIVQPVEEIAEMAVEILLQDKSYARPPLICLPVEFREGGTTRPLA